MIANLVLNFQDKNKSQQFNILNIITKTSILGRNIKLSSREDLLQKHLVKLLVFHQHKTIIETCSSETIGRSRKNTIKWRGNGEEKVEKISDFPDFVSIKNPKTTLKIDSAIGQII